MNKQSFITILLTVLMCMTGAKVFAYDFAVANSDGVTIYYSWANEEKTEVAVCPDHSTYNRYSGNVAIPESVVYEGNTYKVSSIGQWAFQNCKDLTSVTIPNSVTSIDNGAFHDCSGLTSIIIPSSVTSIGYYVFNNCSGLTSITVEAGNTVFDSRDNCNAIIETASNTLIRGCKTTVFPNNVTSISRYAFTGCSGMTSVTIPSSVIYIEKSAFTYCSDLTSIVVEDGNTFYDSRDNCNAIIDTEDNYLVAGCKTTVIPNGVTRIAYDAFAGCSGLPSVEIPNSVTTILGSAFRFCDGLTSVTIPDGVTYLGSEAFYACSNLASVTIPNSVTSLLVGVFHNCSALTSVEIPNSVTSIGDLAFASCTSLKSVEIPNSVTTIGLGAFSKCYSLASVTIPHSVTSIGENAFQDCRVLTSVSIPNSVTSIGKEAFSRCNGLKSVTSLATTPPQANENAFTNYDIPLYVQKGTRDAYLAASPWNMFKEIIEIEESSEREESVALNPYVIWCEDNKTLYFLGNGDDIRNFNYKGHTVTGMWYGETVTKSPENPNSASYKPVPWSGFFRECSKVVFDKSFKNIRVSSTSAWFAGCYMQTIEGIEFLNTSDVTSMSFMFSCPNLINLDVSHFDTRKVKYMQDIFGGCNKLERIDLSNFDTSNVLDMSRMFLKCSALKSLDLSNFDTNKVTNMYYMFSDCTALETINLTNFNTEQVTIMSMMFMGCSSLTTIDLSHFDTSNVPHMGSMFNGCAGLTSLDLSNFSTANVTSMAGMFKDCTNLKTIYVSNKWNTDNVEDRGYEMFANCNKLIGEQGTAYLDINSDILFAHIDGGRSNPGYFTAKGGDLLTVKDIRMNKGQFKTITIDLENITKDFAAYQFYLTLPEGFTLLTDDKGKMKATLGSRYSNTNQSLTVDAFSDGRTYLFLSFPRPEGIIEGNSGPLLSVTIVSNTEQAEGTYSAIVHDVVFTRAGGSELSLTDTRFNIEMTNIKSGDANGDGKVNVSDIVEAMNYIMGKPSEIFDESAADMNGDGKVNVADIVMMVKLIKNQNNEQEETKTDYSKQPFTIVPINSDISVTFWPYYNVVHQGYSILYSKDGGQTWDSTGSDWELSLEVNSDEKLMIIVTGGFFDALSISGGTFNVEGNIMSLIAGKEFESATKIRTRGSTKLNGFFKGNKNLISAENLVLPATDLEENCYANMFEGCTSITKAPILPATRLVKGCYASMFAGCTSLNYVNCSAIDISAPDCTSDWLKDVSPTGTFVKASSMDGWPTGASGIPSGWTVESVPLIPIPY